MESTSIPSHPKSARSRPFQLSLAEAMSVTVLIGLMLCIRHNEMRYDATSEGDLLLTSMILIPSALGEWWSARCGSIGWLRKIRIGTLTLIGLMLYAAEAGTRNLVCSRCGAVKVEKYGLFSYIEPRDRSNVSARIETLCLTKCKHSDWRFGWAHNYDSISDGFPDRYIPILLEHSNVVDLLDKIPNSAWRSELVDSMGNPENRLNFVVYAIICDLSREQPKTQAEWDAWWQANQAVFTPETDLAKALPLAQPVINRLGINRSNRTDLALQSELPEIVLP